MMLIKIQSTARRLQLARIAPFILSTCLASGVFAGNDDVLAQDSDGGVGSSQQNLRLPCDTAACVPPADDVTSDSISQARRNATVKVHITNTGCSGTLATPRMVLTAAHCVRNSRWVPTSVSFGPRGYEQTVQIIACFRQPHFATPQGGTLSLHTLHTPEYGPCSRSMIDGTWRPRHDVAVLILAERVEYTLANSILVIPARVNFTFQEPGTEIRYSGFGGNYEFRQFLISNIENYHDASWVFNEGTMFSGGDIFTQGDSGGSVLIGDPDAEDLEIIGVISGSASNEFERLFDNRSRSAPLSHPANERWLRQFLDGPVDQPGLLDTPIYAGDWDLPLRDEGDRSAASPELLNADLDGDGLIDEHDNCPTIFNPEQRDGEGRNTIDVALDGIADFQDCGLIPLIVATM